METAKKRLRNLGFEVVPPAPSSLVKEECAFFDNIKKAAPNAIFHTKTRFRNDSDPRKINLGIGAYRTNDGKPYVLQVVRQAEALMLANPNLNKEYLPITGHKGFCDAAQKMVFSENSDKICTVQCLSGTGSLRIAACFVAKFLPGKPVYFSDPTWGNHGKIFKACGVETRKYPYWNGETRRIAYDGLIPALNAAEAGSIVLLHATAHNPTGVDPTKNQWKAIASVCRKRGLFPFFDSAYQGFATGNLDRDAWPIRYFQQQGFEMLVCQSFAKNLGLYNERAGALHVVANSAKQATAIHSQIALFIRPMYSNPPVHGAKIVETILTTPFLYEAWKKELFSMSKRISDMRPLLRTELEKLQTPGDWSNITEQIGMFCYTGLTSSQCDALMDNHHVYLLRSGRISMAGVTTHNVKYLAECIDYVVRNH